MSRANRSSPYRYFFVETTDPHTWGLGIRTNIDPSSHSAEIKYDPVAKIFRVLAVSSPHSSGPGLSTSYSVDGLNWSSLETIGPLPAYSHNIGMASDEKGWLIRSGSLQFSFGAPFDLNGSAQFSFWDIYSGVLIFPGN